MSLADSTSHRVSRCDHLAPRSRLRPLLLGMEWFPDTPGGLNRYVRNLHDALWSRGTATHTVVVGPVNEPHHGVREAARLGDPVAVRLRAILREAALAADQTNLIDAHFAMHALPALAHRRLRQKPFVVHFHGPWAEESQSDGQRNAWIIRAKAAVEAFVYRRADAAIVLSQAFKDVLVDQYGVLPTKVHVIEPGVDLHRFRPGDRSQARKRLGLPSTAWVALAVRRLIPRVGLSVLIDAWARADVGRNGSDALLLIAGEGPQREALQRQAEDLGIADRVRFLGKVADDDLAGYYQAVDVSVAPTLELEGFGMIVLESLACATPVIVSDVGGLPEAVRGLQDDVVVPAASVDALADRLDDAWTAARPLPDAARCRAHAEEFTWARAAAQHEYVYQQVVNRSARPRVVYLDHCARLSGGELALVRLLSALPVDAHVILAEDGPLVDRLRGVGATVEVMPLQNRARQVSSEQVRGLGAVAVGAMSTFRHVLELRRRLRRLRPDAVHTNSLKSALYGGLAGRLAGVPVVWHLRDRISSDTYSATAISVVRAAARVLPRRIIANSATTKDALGDVGTPLEVVASPVAITQDQGIPAEPRAPCSAVSIGMLGRVAPWKGQHVFLRAFARAFPNNDVRAVIIGSALFGEAAYEDELRALADELGVASRTEFRGFRDDVGAELARLDVLVHASVRPEPFGQVVVEGMAAGLAVVAADAGGPAETIEHEVTGLLYPPGDIDTLAACLCRLADDPVLREALGRRGIAEAGRYAPTRIADEVIAIYGRVLEDAPSNTQQVRS